jgi:hypothetical protein
MNYELKHIILTRSEESVRRAIVILMRSEEGIY